MSDSNFSNIEIDITDGEIERYVDCYVRQHFNPASVSLFNEVFEQTKDIKEALMRATLNDHVINALKLAIHMEELNNNNKENNSNDNIEE